MCIHPLVPDQHPEGTVMNVVTGRSVPQSVNVDKLIAIGTKQMN